MKRARLKAVLLMRAYWSFLFYADRDREERPGPSCGERAKGVADSEESEMRSCVADPYLLVSPSTQVEIEKRDQARCVANERKE